MLPWPHRLTNGLLPCGRCHTEFRRCGQGHTKGGCLSNGVARATRNDPRSHSGAHRHSPQGLERRWYWPSVIAGARCAEDGWRAQASAFVWYGAPKLRLMSFQSVALSFQSVLLCGRTAWRGFQTSDKRSKKKKKGVKEVFQFYIYKLPIDRHCGCYVNTRKYYIPF